MFILKYTVTQALLHCITLAILHAVYEFYMGYMINMQAKFSQIWALRMDVKKISIYCTFSVALYFPILCKQFVNAE